MRYVGFALVLFLVAVGLNLIWLAKSTVRIANESNMPISSIAYQACEKAHLVGGLRPNQAVFRFLEACGDDTLEILIGGSKFCQIYVEGDLYHVDAAIRTAETVHCTYDDPFSSLFVAKMLW